MPTRDHLLTELTRKIDEVRALSDLPPLSIDGGEESTELLVEAATSLLDEVERHKRRLIETTVLLAAISELLSAMLFSGDPQPALASLCHFLRGAFRLDWIHVGILDPDGTALAGPVVHVDAEGKVREGYLSRSWNGEPAVFQTVLDSHRKVILRGSGAAAATGDPEARGLRLLACLPIGRGEADSVLSAAVDLPLDQREAPLAVDPVRGILAVGRNRDEEIDRDHLALLKSLAVSIGTALDNSRLTQRLGEAMRFRDHVLESMIDGVVVVDRESRVLTINEVAEKLLCLPREEALGEPFPKGLLDDKDLPGDPIERTLASPAETRRSEGWISAPGQDRRPARLAVTPLRDEKGLVYGALVTFFDLTEIREMERRIRHLDRIATLGRFTSSVAHEIRNPLAGIAAGIEYLGMSIPDADPSRQHLDFVTREVSRLDRIVSDLSLATRPHDPQPQPVRIETLVSETVETVRNHPDAAEAQIEIDLEPDLGPALVDPDHLSQVMVNLLLNAVQAAGDCSVTVRAGAKSGPPEEPPRIWVAVEDSGPGIPADNVERIFEPFFTTKKAGTGLGLYICHEMVERNGGEITARNLPGRGAQFLIELPGAPRPAPHTAPRPAAGLSSR
jgi:PAS domain S-box-containing protein